MTSTVQDYGDNIIWSDIMQSNNLVYNPTGQVVGINPDLIECLTNGRPYDFYSIFVDDTIIDMLVLETNRYASQLISTPHKSKSRLTRWENVTKKEMLTFLGICMWMGLTTFPSIASYWSKKLTYQFSIPQYMCRNRFELLLRTFHCSNNVECPKGDRLFKVRDLIDSLVDKYKCAMIPEEHMCIDESIIPFVGRLSFRQYIKNKHHRYGIKIFKLCIQDAYTIGFRVYTGREAEPGVEVSTKIVMEMSEEYLDFGRTLYTDNWYTSINLAHKLLSRSTNLVGTLRANRKHNPQDVVKHKLKKGEIVAQKSNTGILILKWKDKRDVLMLSTKHEDNIRQIQTKIGTEVGKPEVVLDYNRGKGLVDVSDLRSSYHTPLRRSMKWYRKVAFEVLLNTSVINALILYNKVNNCNMSVTEFRESIILSMIEKPATEIENIEMHSIVEKTTRNRCAICYQKLVLKEGRAYAQSKTKKVRTMCSACDKFYCVECFFADHKYKKKNK